MFLVFKQYYTHFHTLFYPLVFPHMFSSNKTHVFKHMYQTPLVFLDFFVFGLGLWIRITNAAEDNFAPIKWSWHLWIWHMTAI